MEGLEEYKNLTRVLVKIGKKVRDDYKKKLKTPDKRGFNAIATGKLFNSVEYKIKITDNNIKLIFVAADHYIFVEEGRKVQTSMNKVPPINVIRKWILNKKINKSPNIEYKIQRSINFKGVIARPFYKQVTKNIVNYNKEIEKALKKDITEYVKNKVKKELKNIK